jgi:NADPH-dependent glutamate synthase beta subunit-like oxidoreductase
VTEKPALRLIGLVLLVLIVSLLVSPATMMLTLAVLGDHAQQIVADSDGDPVVVIGAGNSGNQFHRTSRDMEMLARTLAGLEQTPEVTDEVLERIRAAILQRAADGDLEAAAVVARIAEAQRRAGPAGAP